MMNAPVSRQQKRRLDREQIKSGRAIITSGLPAQPKRAAMRDIAQVLRAKLTERDNVHRAGEAAAIAHEIAETALRRHPATIAIACRKGCSYCCYSYVGTVPPEVFRIATAIQNGKAAGLDAQTVQDRAAPLRSLSPDARIGAKLACPLLEQGQCSVYADRPLTCRQATSLSVDACRDEFDGKLGDTDRVEVSSTHLAHASNAHVALLGAMRAVGLPTTAYELTEALAVALATPDAERRWLNGEDILHGVARMTQRPAEIDFVARMIADDIAA